MKLPAHVLYRKDLSLFLWKPHGVLDEAIVSEIVVFVGTAEAYAEVDRPNALRTLSNATGDQIVTEGKISVVQLATSKRPADGPIVLKPQ